MATQNNISLKSAKFVPATFTASTYKPVTEDLTLLQKSLEQREARMNKAYEQQSAIDTALGGIETKLNEAEGEWFANYKNDIKSQIQEQINIGNFGGAYRTATALAGKMGSDSQILGRLEANANYTAAVDKLNKRVGDGKISPIKRDWWLATHDYNYTDKYDSKGNIIRGDTRAFNGEEPTDSVDWIAVANTAFKMYSPDKNSSNTGTNTQHINADGTGYTTGNQTANSYERKYVENIRDNIKSIIQQMPGGAKAVEEDYKAYVWECQKFMEERDNLIEQLSDMQLDIGDDEELQNLEEFQKLYDKLRTMDKQLEVRNKLTMKNGGPLDYEEYAMMMIFENSFADNLSYDWNTYQETTTDKVDDQPVNGGNGRGNGNSNANSYGNSSENGPVTEMTTTFTNPQYLVSPISNTFNEAGSSVVHTEK